MGTYLVSGFPATQEQATAIDCALNGQDKRLSLKINAGAGTGKTSLLKVMGSLLFGNGLYIAFNKSIADEAQEFFPEGTSNVTASTGHSLAYRSVGYKYRKRFGRLYGSTVTDILNNEGFGKYTDVQMANLALSTLRQYCYSKDKKILADHIPSLGPSGTLSHEEALELTQLRNEIVLLTRRLWREMANPRSKLPVTPDFYMKEWALSEPVLDYDFIFLDEAQDSNEVLIDVLQKQNVQMIWVGDEFQSIYGWRGATNAMAKIQTDHQVEITQSFRFGQAIADLANHVLSSQLNTSFKVRGSESIQSTISPVSQPDAILCRTNQMAMRETLSLLSKGIPAVFSGDTEALISSIMAVGELKKKGFTTHPDFISFNSYRELLDYANSDEGTDYSVLLKMIGEHGQYKLTEKLREMKSVKSNNDDHILITTAHKSKGHEWDNVILAEDFILPSNSRWTPEEANLLYVAITRAKLALDVTRIPELLNRTTFKPTPKQAYL